MSTSGRGQVLLPWPNRLEDGSYEFEGRRHQLPLTEPEHRNAIHGLVRWAAWSRRRARAEPGRRWSTRSIPSPATRSRSRSVSSTPLGGRPSRPDDGDEHRAAALPYGCGAHPYLNVGTATVDLCSCACRATVVQCDERGLPTGTTTVEGTDYDFRQSRPIGATSSTTPSPT